MSYLAIFSGPGWAFLVAGATGASGTSKCHSIPGTHCMPTVPDSGCEGDVLHNRASFLSWVGQLVGLEFDAPIRVHLRHERRLPAIVLTGGHGSGRTAVLEALAARYGNHTPLAYLDLAQQRFAEPPQGIGAAGAVVIEPPLIRLLHSAIWGFTPGSRDTGPLRLPRLNLLLLVISLWSSGQSLTRTQADQLLAGARPQVESLLSGGGEGPQLAAEWVREVLARLAAGLPLPYPIDAVLSASIDVFMRRALTSRQRKTVLRWWKEHRPSQAGEGLDKVLATARDFHAGGAYRDRAEEDLVAALLADLDAEFGEDRSFRLRRPLLLIDNLHRDPAGPRLLDLILQNRKDTPDPLVLVASALTYEARRHWPSARTVAIEGCSGSTDPLLLVTLSPLGLDDTLKVFDELHQSALQDPTAASMAERPHDNNLPQVIHRLTDGSPLAVRTFANAAFRQVDAIDLAGLLNLPISAGNRPEVSAATYLLEQLVPDQQVRDYLVLFAPAEDDAAALVLADQFLNDVRRGESVRRAEQFLHEAGSPTAGTGFFVGDRLLRTLLLHSLRTMGSAAGPGWGEVHRCLHDHYARATGADGGQLDKAGLSRLRHALSLGRSGEVADQLAAAFAESGQCAWLRALTYVASAPYGGTPAGRRVAALGDWPPQRDRAAAQPAVPEVQRAVSRLLHAAWYLGDPLTPPDTDAIGRLMEDLRVLASKSVPGGRIYFNAAQEWSAALLGWRQDPGWIAIICERS